MTCMGCFKRCFEIRGFGVGYTNLKDQPAIVLDTRHMGQDVVIVKSGHRICGTGAALASAPIVQNKAYFEVKVQQTGIWGLGLATLKADLDRAPLGRDVESWVLRSDGTLVHKDEVLHKLSDVPQEGDVIGVTFDHVELNFYLNGKELQCPLTNVTCKGGELYPVLYVDDGAILDAAFATFQQQPPPGFDRIMLEQSLL